MPTPNPQKLKRAPDRPYTDEEREAVRTRHAAGMSRNAISRETGIHMRKVSALAAQQGLTFRRAAHVKEAVEAKKVDAAARRAAIALALLDDAERMRQQLFAPMIAFNFGGRDNTYEEHPIPEPTARDKRDLAGAVTGLLTTAMRLDEYDRDTGATDERSVLGDLMKGLKEAWHLAQDDDPQ